MSKRLTKTQVLRMALYDAIASQRDKVNKITRARTGLLREVDPSVDPEHVAHLPSIEASEEDAE